jgi:MFS family permease
MGGAAWLGALGFYWAPSLNLARPLPFLLIAYCWFKFASGVMTVGANSASTELFPAALRTTMIGWQGITAAVFSVVAQTSIAAMIGPLSGLLQVIRYFAFLGIPCAIIFALFIDETRGLSLEESSKEHEWEKTQHHASGRLILERRLRARG